MGDDERIEKVRIEIESSMDPKGFDDVQKRLEDIDISAADESKSLTKAAKSAGEHAKVMETLAGVAARVGGVLGGAFAAGAAAAAAALAVIIAKTQELYRKMDEMRKHAMAFDEAKRAMNALGVATAHAGQEFEQFVKHQSDQAGLLRTAAVDQKEFADQLERAAKIQKEMIDLKSAAAKSAIESRTDLQPWEKTQMQSEEDIKARHAKDAIDRQVRVAAISGKAVERQRILREGAEATALMPQAIKAEKLAEENVEAAKAPLDVSEKFFKEAQERAAWFRGIEKKKEEGVGLSIADRIRGYKEAEGGLKGLSYASVRDKAFAEEKKWANAKASDQMNFDRAEEALKKRQDYRSILTKRAGDAPGLAAQARIEMDRLTKESNQLTYGRAAAQPLEDWTTRSDAARKARGEFIDYSKKKLGMWKQGVMKGIAGGVKTPEQQRTLAGIDAAMSALEHPGEAGKEFRALDAWNTALGFRAESANERIRIAGQIGPRAAWGMVPQQAPVPTPGGGTPSQGLTQLETDIANFIKGMSDLIRAENAKMEAIAQERRNQ